MFAKARHDLDAGRTVAARQGFEQSIVVVPELADHSLFHAGTLARRAGDRTAAARHFDRLLRRHPRSIWVSSAATARGEMDLEAGSPERALTHFDKALRAWESKSRSAAMLGKARALERLERLPEAYALAWELAGAPGEVGRNARLLRERLEQRGAKAVGLSSTRLAQKSAEARLEEDRPAEALQALRPALAAGPSGRTSLLEARILKRAGRASEARVAYGRAASSSDPDAAAEALAERARLAWNADRNEDAATDFRLLVERHPTHEQASEALYALGRIAESKGRPTEAARHYRNVARHHPHSKTAEESAWRTGFVRYLNGDPGGAAKAWQGLDGREDALYWAGRAHAAAGRTGESQAAFSRLVQKSPQSYYTWWMKVPERFDHRPTRIPPVSAATVPEAARAHVERARLLRQLGFRDDAMRELAGAQSAAGPTALLLQEYEALDAHRQVIRLAARLRSQGVSGLDRKLRPLAHWPHFQKAASRYDLDPLLLASIARQESMFDERIASPANAQGVMQLLPGTADKLAGRTMKRWELWDPAVNIDLGARYFRQMLDRFDGRAIPAIAAYNAGPSPAARWLAENGQRPGDEFVELITYRETRGYVKKVLENYRIYRTLYGKPDAPRTVLF